ncbi:MAG TPA: hypothetical protein PLS67_10630 [Accumulibacter sp.]|jgi:hypothetical protein|nr:hypothetical protein [Accumulibacter sp.]HQC80952.1 hypothetical protein [Accumulibacter sp.]
MTTPPIITDNKTALRASLKKEDESLAVRLAESEIPLLSTPTREAPAVVAEDPPPVKETVSAIPPATPEVKKLKGSRKIDKKAAKKAAKKTDTKAEKKAAGKAGKTTEKSTKVVKVKPEKVVRYPLELPKSEGEAIENLRVDLSKAAGWTASKSDIVRAAVHLFAEQKVGAMKELLASVALPPKRRKKS